MLFCIWSLWRSGVSGVVVLSISVLTVIVAWPLIVALSHYYHQTISITGFQSFSTVPNTLLLCQH
eukprot:COSAG01_NODE_1978_length_8747_cov_87.182007_1_plen_65_part_00